MKNFITILILIIFILAILCWFFAKSGMEHSKIQDKISLECEKLSKHIDERADAIESRLDKIEKSLEKLDSIEKKLDRLLLLAMPPLPDNMKKADSF